MIEPELDLDTQGKYYWLMINQSDFDAQYLSHGFPYSYSKDIPFTSIFFDYEYCKAHAEIKKEPQFLLKIAISIRKAEELFFNIFLKKDFEMFLIIDSVEKVNQKDLK